MVYNVVHFTELAYQAVLIFIGDDQAVCADDQQNQNNNDNGCVSEFFHISPFPHITGFACDIAVIRIIWRKSVSGCGVSEPAYSSATGILYSGDGAVWSLEPLSCPGFTKESMG